MNIFLFLLILFLLILYILEKIAESNYFVYFFIIPLSKVTIPIVFIVLSISIIFIGKYKLINLIYIIPYILYISFFYIKNLYILKKEKEYYDNINEYKENIYNLVKDNYNVILNKEDIIINFSLKNKKIVKCIIKIIIDKELEKDICSHMFDLRDLLIKIYCNHEFDIFYELKK